MKVQLLICNQLAGLKIMTSKQNGSQTQLEKQTDMGSVCPHECKHTLLQLHLHYARFTYFLLLLLFFPL